MAKGSNQKLKLSYLTKIMLEKTDDEHGLTLQQVMDELARYDVPAERKSLYADFADMTDKLGVEIIKEKRGRETTYHVAGRDFEVAEVKLLIDAIQSSKFITEKKSNELTVAYSYPFAVPKYISKIHLKILGFIFIPKGSIKI